MHKLTKTRFVHNKTSISQSPKKPGKFRKKTLPPKFNTEPFHIHLLDTSQSKQNNYYRASFKFYHRT